MSRWFRIAALAITAVAGAAAAGCSRDRAAAAGPGPGASGPPTPVTVLKPERKTLRRASVQPGTIEAFEEAPLSAKVSGFIRELVVDIGDEVKEGQVLAELSVPEMEADLKEKEALVAQARSEGAQASAAVQVAEAAVAVSKARIAEASASQKESDAVYELRKAELARHRELAAGDAVDQRLVEEKILQFQAADAGKDAAAARLESARQGVKETEAKVVKARADVDAAAARLQVAAAERERAQALLEYSKIRAPFDGLVTRRNVHRGRLIGAADREPLLVVARTDPVRVLVDVPEKDAVLADRDQPALVTVQALGGATFPGKVKRTAWALDPRSRTLRVEVEVPNPDRKLRPGMYAQVAITLEERRDALTVPLTAVVQQGDKAFCVCVCDGKAVLKPVVLGLRDGISAEIRSGLSGDEDVVQGNVAMFRENMAVQIVPASK